MMNPKPRTPEETYGPALRKAHQEFLDLDPRTAATCAGVQYNPPPDGGPAEGCLHVPFFGAVHQVTWPSGQIERLADRTPADIATRILLLHYLLTADGAPLAGEWIAFRNLPGGLGYDAAFQGRANRRLARAFGHDAAAFRDAARALHGETLSFGDASFLFRVLPHVWLAVVLYLADEEFSASANVLFDATASHYLPTEDLAVLGGLLAGRLIKASRAT